MQCGRVLNPPIEGMIGDHTGNNISEKNRDYCELTAHYFVWKNIRADYYGFCHYRRFFCFDERIKKTYLALGRLSQRQKERLLGNAEKNRELILGQDIVIPYAERMEVSVRDYYITAKNQYAADLELFLEIVKEKYPNILPFAEQYLAQEKHYFCNMFIMRKEFFSEYCEILFSVLEEFDFRKTHSGDRTDGYLGEIFTGIYITYAKSKNAKIKEITRIDVNCTLKKRLGCFLFPPESRRRLILKKAIRRVRT
ncbi:MAG: DUF4422 domain-containing protein [Bacteroides sp.]|nr:DUF4422 domain-containing protein [Eubacterium sp.]MCM1417965.1 DUF4422 domain-containing protein [Roseburia sp.]MCM1461788.1 DUF4422 domain-containing protein [Bacteroides sp.]